MQNVFMNCVPGVVRIKSNFHVIYCQLCYTLGVLRPLFKCTFQMNEKFVRLQVTSCLLNGKHNSSRKDLMDKAELYWNEITAPKED